MDGFVVIALLDGFDDAHCGLYQSLEQARAHVSKLKMADVAAAHQVRYGSGGPDAHGPKLIEAIYVMEYRDSKPVRCHVVKSVPLSALAKRDSAK